MVYTVNFDLLSRFWTQNAFVFASIQIGKICNIKQQNWSVSLQET